MTTDSSFSPNDPAGAAGAPADTSAVHEIDEGFSDDDGVLYDEEVTPEYGILGFTLRELLIVGVWLVAFIVSFFPVAGGLSLWAVGIEWILPIGLPTVAVFLIVLRRFSPDGIRRVGSLGIDQFASVAFSVAACLWIGDLWLAIAGVIDHGRWVLGWSAIVLLIASLALVVLTVFAPLIPGLREDFHGRLVTLAHRNANPVRPVIPRPRPTTQWQDERTAEPEAVSVDSYAAPAPSGLDSELSGQYATDEVARFDVAGQVPLSAHASGGGTGTTDPTADDDYVPSYARRSGSPEIVSDTASIEALVTPEPETEAFPADVPTADTAVASPEAFPPAAETATPPSEAFPSAAPAEQPFWILAPTERDVHDERGEPVFRIGPAAWALVIEDRGGAYVVRHDDGRIGYLHDIADISRG